MNRILSKQSLLVLLILSCMVFAGNRLSAVDPAVHPRIFTPNGDNINDKVIFNFSNPDPSGTAPIGSIFDIQGHRIADLDLRNTTDEIIPGEWDGNDINGNPAECGIYIYQIETSTKTFNGTVVLAR